MDKTERAELRRLLRGRFKLLRSDVVVRGAELQVELEEQITARFAQRDQQFDDAVYRLSLVVDEANRQANDIARELHGAQNWGIKTDRAMIICHTLPRPSVGEKKEMRAAGIRAIEQRVRDALLALDRQENDLLTGLATSALASVEAKEFFGRIPSVSELVPSYRLKEITTQQG